MRPIGRVYVYLLTMFLFLFFLFGPENINCQKTYICIMATINVSVISKAIHKSKISDFVYEGLGFKLSERIII